MNASTLPQPSTNRIYRLSGITSTDDDLPPLDAIPEAPVGAPAKISALFEKLGKTITGFRGLFEQRDNAEVAAKIAADTFDSDPSPKNHAALVAALKALGDLRDTLPADERGLLEVARERIFNDPASWLALSDALRKRATICHERAVLARERFAEAVRSFFAQTDALEFVASYSMTDSARALYRRATEAREVLTNLINTGNFATEKANLCHHIGNGQQRGPDQNFESIADILATPIPELLK